jgi:predicted glycoside hydrolase/deacetylase ChbG (UPF0249 family)
LNAASLMVAGPSAAQAVKLARTMPNLRIGLHLVLVEGVPASPPEDIPDLIGRQGMLRTDMVRLAYNIALRPRVRRQLRREITAQFELFRRTGLALDHVNAHKHFHVHPLIAGDVLKIGRAYGMQALRVPHEPAGVVVCAERAANSASPLPLGEVDARSASGEGLQPRESSDPPHPNSLPKRERERAVSAATVPNQNGFVGIMSPWTALLRARARRAGLTTPDAVFGLRFSGAMTAGRLRELLDHLPDGLVEIYTHPATSDTFAGHAPNYRYADELRALTDPEVIEALRRSGRRLRGYADMFAMPLGAGDSLSPQTSGSRL